MKEVIGMMYPFLTLNDDTEITHSEMNNEGVVKVYIEKPDEKDGFHYATIFLPSYERGEVFKFTESEMEGYTDIIRHSQKCILRFAREGGFDSASNNQDG